VGRSWTGWLAGCAAVLAAAALPARALAHGDDLVILLSTPADEARSVDLEVALRAALSDRGARAEAEPVPGLPADLSSQMTVARAALASRGALAVVWHDPVHARVCILASRWGSEQFLTRELPGAGTGFDGDAAAAMVRSVLAPWLTGPSIVARVAASPARGPADSEPVPQPPPKPAGPSDEGLPWSVRASGGFAGLMMSHGGPFLTGGTAGLDAGIGPYFELGAEADFFARVEAHRAGKDIAMERWPLRIHAAGVLPVGPLRAGARAGCVLDFTRIIGLDPYLVHADLERTRAGLAVSLFLRYALVPWLEIWLDLGSDLFFKETEFDLAGAEVMHYGAWQPRIAAGLSLVLDRRLFSPAATGRRQ
jgi:hypothetical protein